MNYNNTRQPRCYLCNCAFLDNKVYEQMFEKRFNAAGIEQNTLSSILEMVLQHKLEEEQLHSSFVCSTCKVSLLNFEALELQLSNIRREIQETHEKTRRLYEPKIEELRIKQLKKESSYECPESLDEFTDSDTNLIEECFKITEIKLEHCSQGTDLIEECFDEDEEEVDLGAPTVGNQTDCGTTFSCSYCGKVCARRARLVEHERIHTGERPFKCEVCGVGFAQRANLRTHTQTTHLNKTNFKCNDCGKAFKRKRLLDNHIKSIHTKVRDLKCDHCGATFGNSINFKKHMLCHTGVKNFTCKICGKDFSRAENRDIHHFVHSITKPYACSVCGKGFMRKQQLQHHSKSSNHPNQKIVRLKPQFSAANSDKLLQLKKQEKHGEDLNGHFANIVHVV